MEDRKLPLFAIGQPATSQQQQRQRHEIGLFFEDDEEKLRSDLIGCAASDVVGFAEGQSASGLMTNNVATDFDHRQNAFKEQQPLISLPTHFRRPSTKDRASAGIGQQRVREVETTVFIVINIPLFDSTEY